MLKIPPQAIISSFDELNEVSDLPTYDELHNAFKELHNDWMRICKKNASLKKNARNFK